MTKWAMPRRISRDNYEKEKSLRQYNTGYVMEQDVLKFLCSSYVTFCVCFLGGLGFYI